MNKVIYANIVDPMEQTVKAGRIHQIKVCKSGMLGKIEGTNFNVFRPWNQTAWMTNVTSSTRFNMETEGMTAEEIAIFLQESKS